MIYIGDIKPEASVNYSISTVSTNKELLIETVTDIPFEIET